MPQISTIRGLEQALWGLVDTIATSMDLSSPARRALRGHTQSLMRANPDEVVMVNTSGASLISPLFERKLWYAASELKDAGGLP